jgi:hypothetical protein
VDPKFIGCPKRMNLTMCIFPLGSISFRLEWLNTFKFLILVTNLKYKHTVSAKTTILGEHHKDFINPINFGMRPNFLKISTSVMVDLKRFYIDK